MVQCPNAHVVHVPEAAPVAMAVHGRPIGIAGHMPLRNAGRDGGPMVAHPRLPELPLPATYLKMREGGRIVSVAAIIAVAVNTDGKREIVGLHIGPSEAEPFWTSFLRDLVRRGLTGVKLVVSDAHEGLKAAITRVLGATWQRCRVHAMRNALAYVPKGQHTMVAAAIRQAFIQPDHAGATQTWRQVADQLRARWPKLGAFMDDAEADVLAYMAFPSQHRRKLHSTNPLERLNKEVAGCRRHLPQRGQHRCLIGRSAGSQRVAASAPIHAVEAMADLNTSNRGGKTLQITPRAA